MKYMIQQQDHGTFTRALANMLLIANNCTQMKTAAAAAPADAPNCATRSYLAAAPDAATATAAAVAVVASDSTVTADLVTNTCCH